MYVVLFGLVAWERMARPTEEFIYGESWLLDGARRIAHGEGLYAPATEVPLMHIAYTPLYYALVGGLQRLFGDSGYTLGRLVSLVSTIAGACLLAWMIRRITSRWSYGLLAAGLFLTQNLTALLWASLHRVDALALGLTLGGLALFAAGRVSLAALVFVLALMTKQTFFVAPLAAFLALWPYRPAMVRFAATLGGGGLLFVAAAQWLSGGWFWWHTVVANGNQPDLATFATLVGTFLQYNGLAVVAALAACALPSAPGERVWRFYVVGCLITLVSVAKLGASSNYWLELSAAVAALLAIASGKLAAWPTVKVVGPTVLAGALLVAVPAYQATAMEVAINGVDLLRTQRPQFLSLVGDGEHYDPPIRVDARFVDSIAREPGDVLTDNSGLAVAAGKRIAYEFQIFQLLSAEGQWSDQPIIDAVYAHRFSLVALMHPLDAPIRSTRWTPGVVAALRSSYQPSGEQAGFWLYRPNLTAR